jgi:hypothetical protein
MRDEHGRFTADESKRMSDWLRGVISGPAEPEPDPKPKGPGSADGGARAGGVVMERPTGNDVLRGIAAGTDGRTEQLARYRRALWTH